jgi:ribosomal protein S18 acetylase RimI-like enzyme
MSISIRPASIEDADAIIALDRSVRNHADEPAHAADWLDPSPAKLIHEWIAAGECYLATLDGRVAGYGVLQHHFFHEAMIDMIIVGEEFRRRGVGVALVRYLATQCRSDRLWISTNLSNQKMQALIAGEGFKMSGFIDDLDPGDPELIYHKMITPKSA